MNNNPKFKFTVDTEVTEDGIINQGVYDHLLDQHVHNVINTRDNQVKEALIKLGWTPPSNSKLYLSVFTSRDNWFAVCKHVFDALCAARWSDLFELRLYKVDNK